jgi:hypothetical protein
LYLNLPLTRYQLALILKRLAQKGFLKIIKKDCKIDLEDINLSDSEFLEALKFVYCNRILKGDGRRFYPWTFLTGAQFLAVIGRLFAGLKDDDKIWYKNYLSWAKKNKLISENWKYLNAPVPRRVVFEVL